MNNLTLAGCVLPNQAGEILLIHRNTEKRVQWEVPGGKIEEGEEAISTAAREIQEELGVEVNILKELGSKEFTEDNFMMHYTWYLAEITKGEPRLMEDNYDELRYFSWADLTKMTEQLSPNTRNLVAAYVNNEINL